MTDTIEELERKLQEANAKVADAFAEWRKSARVPSGEYQTLLYLNDEREKALAALAAAREPKLLTVEEVITLTGWFDGKNTRDGVQAVLDAARDRFVKMIEACPGKWKTANGREHVPLDEIRRAMGAS